MSNLAYLEFILILTFERRYTLRSGKETKGRSQRKITMDDIIQRVRKVEDRETEIVLLTTNAKTCFQGEGRPFGDLYQFMSSLYSHL